MLAVNTLYVFLPALLAQYIAVSENFSKVWFASTILAGRVASTENVELDDGGLIFGQQAQTRVAGADIVDRAAKAETALFAENIDQMGPVLHLLALGHVKDEALDRKLIKLQRCKGAADARFRPLDCLRQEIDWQ